MGDAPVGQFWRLDRVVAETGLCVRSIYEAMANGTFPRNFPISNKRAPGRATRSRLGRPQSLRSAINSTVNLLLTLLEHAAEATRSARAQLYPQGPQQLIRRGKHKAKCVVFRGDSKCANPAIPSGTAANDQARQAQNQIRGSPKLNARGQTAVGRVERHARVPDLTAA
jgi:hypothetical protein